LKAIFKAREAKRQQEREADEEFHKNYEPLASALGLVSVEVKRNMQENSHKLLGPGRFGMERYSNQNWLPKMTSQLTKEEEMFIEKQAKEQEEEMDVSEVSVEDRDDEIMSQ